MNQFNKPILFIVFNRLDTTKKVFDQIRKIKPPKLYIASDGPRNESEKLKVLQVREFIMKNIDWSCEIKTKFREKNLGVGFGPNDAITWFFSEEESGIILEDDCLPSISFFEFCNELLDLYKNNKKVGVIQGFNPFPRENYLYSYFFSKYDLKWGWATWRDRWEYQDMYTIDWPQVKKSNFLSKISRGNRLVKLYWELVFDQIHRNPSLAWDVQFTYQILKRNLLTIVPKKNLILNIGYREDASSTKWEIPKHIKLLNLDEIEFPLIHPQEIKTCEEYDNLVETIHFEMNLRTILRYKFRNFLDSNAFTRKTFLPVFTSIYRGYKYLKLKLKR
ncbi:MAG: nucleotide-diphospho-sugar transferase [Dictyoglomus sp. NZ13-RE01]|nr:MAG: nucleotide-diphospho-sugar transferase [Dictyoglomus sp. NZ13-RE01]